MALPRVHDLQALPSPRVEHPTSRLDRGADPTHVIAEQFAEAAGMRAKPPANYTVADLRRLITRPSPVYVAFSMSATAAHAVAIIGMSGDGTSVGTDLILHDTAVGSPPDRLPFVMMNLWVDYAQHLRNRDKVGEAEMPNSQLLFF